MTSVPRHLTCGLVRNWRRSGIAFSAWLSLGLAGPGHAAVDVIAEYRLGTGTPQITYTSGPETMPDSAGRNSPNSTLKMVRTRIAQFYQTRIDYALIAEGKNILNHQNDDYQEI